MCEFCNQDFNRADEGGTCPYCNETYPPATAKQARLPEVSTHAFERNYGKKPRGRGSWAFCPAEHYRANNYLDYTKFFQGTFAEARKAAREHFRGQTDEIETCT